MIRGIGAHHMRNMLMGVVERALGSRHISFRYINLRTSKSQADIENR